MFEKIKNELKRLEMRLMPAFIDTDEDGFLTALVGEDRKEKYRNSNGGYDVMAAMNDIAAEDWSDYVP